MSRKMRLPNGFGQITKIKNKRLRNPYRVMITVGKTDEGKPICKLLKPQSYFRTYNDAYAALVEYNKNPYELNSLITVKELYDRWLPEYSKTLKSDSSIRTVTSAWSYCSEIYDVNVKDVRARHIKKCMDEGVNIVRGEVRHTSPRIKSRIKSLFNLMLDYAVEYEIVDTNYSRNFNVSDRIRKEEKINTKGHMAFTDDEINILWENVDRIPFVDTILIQCYSGWRPQEMGLLKIENINLKDRTMIGGMKTAAGINRIVPIHTKILKLVEEKYNEAVRLNSEYLINTTNGYNNESGLKMTYSKYRFRFIKVIEELKLNPEHKSHDPRMHFITMAKKYNVDEYAIKYIVGHSISDITEKVYTERNIEWLKDEMEKIK